MKKRLTLTIVLLALVAVTAVFVGRTYAKYVSAFTGTTTTNVADWAIQVNEETLTAGTVTKNITCVYDTSDVVVANKVAPGRNCYFDLAIKPAGTEVAFSYVVSIGSTTNKPTNMTISGKYNTGTTTYADATATALTFTAGVSSAREIALPGETNARTIMTTAQNEVVRITLSWPYATTDGDVSDTTDGIAAAAVTIPVTVTFTQKSA